MMDKVVDANLPWDTGNPRPIHILPDTPPLLSMGTTIESGFSFYWNNGFYPCLVSGKTKQIFLLDVSGGLPVMVQGGSFEKSRDQKIIQALTGIHMVTDGDKTRITHEVLNPSDARIGLETCQVLREYAMTLGHPTACTAKIDDEEWDDERMEEKRSRRREIEEEIKRASERQ